MDARPVVGYLGKYEVSDLGRVRGLPRLDGAGRRLRGSILKQTKNKSGHWYVSLHDMGQASKTVHTIMAEAFLPNPNGLPLVRHLDDNASRNVLSNLAWGTKSDNHADAVRNGKIVIKTHCSRGHEKRGANLTRDGACRTCRKDRSRQWRERRAIKLSGG